MRVFSFWKIETLLIAVTGSVVSYWAMILALKMLSRWS